MAKPFPSPKTLKTGNTSAKQEQTASERPKQTYRTKRMSQTVKGISSHVYPGSPLQHW